MLLHLLLLFPLAQYGRYDFAKPVNMLQAVMVDLPVEGKPAISGPIAGGRPPVEEKQKRVQKAIQNPPPVDPDEGPSSVFSAEKEVVPAPGTLTGEEAGSAPIRDSLVVKPAKSIDAPRLSKVPPPLRVAGEFTTTQRERLNYRISLMGMPIGTAELEAKNDKGEINISLKVRSTPAISAIYPVDDLIETRHIAGNFIIMKIRQQEGGFRSHRGFTIFLRDRSVFWIDLLRNRTSRETIPNSQVLDLMSAFYYLRNRPLQVGTQEQLDVYDSDTYTAIPVEVLRREHISLPAFRQADTIVVKPNLKTDGIFKRTGDVTIWLTDDQYHVPVRLETSIPLGRITAELVSSQVDKAEPATPTPPVSLQKQ